jgi:hypothetical protein
MIDISLKFIDLNLITVVDLPEKLERLQLKRCEIPVNWFSNNNFKNLYTLDLSDSSRTTTQHIRDLAQSSGKTLKTLILSNCYRVVDASIDLLTNEFLNLVCLKINGTKCTSLSVHFICNRLKLIETIDARDCAGIGTVDLEYLRKIFTIDQKKIQLYS